ncbi:hypothetical protein [Candidatus Bartonella washoeensis]|uniref:Uncharacterized protein n=1 Tax=Cardidatus Bartonella washoeensis 085-0475 TaxID=1094564 RepID=J0Z4M5_9HYPH|nr:hypothetical protein [Bartonella washoeensis]EJF82493.1 hypothetical protein MCW_01660 [Bartonella washoeensis 085-0475]
MDTKNEIIRRMASFVHPVVNSEAEIETIASPTKLKRIMKLRIAFNGPRSHKRKRTNAFLLTCILVTDFPPFNVMATSLSQYIENDK